MINFFRNAGGLAGKSCESSLRDYKADHNSYEKSKEIARSGDLNSRRALASNESTKPEVLYFLADDQSPEVRRNIAANTKTPRQADLILAEDQNDDVRCDLALKICRLLPEVTTQETQRLKELTFQILEIIAKDHLPSIRQILAEEIKRSSAVPKRLVRELAEDVAVIVSAPILEFSPLLSDEDLLEIIAARPIDERLSAVARRSKVSVSVSDAIIRANDVPALAALLANKNSQIREETLDKVIERAEDLGKQGELLHEPLAGRPELSGRAIGRIMRFVATSVLRILQDRHDLDQSTANEIAARVSERIRNNEDDDQSGEAWLKAKTLFEDGRINDEGLFEAISAKEHDVIICAVALKTGITMNVVKRILESGNGKSISSLSWRAGLSMTTAVMLQREICSIPYKNMIFEQDDGSYPMREDEMSWCLDFFMD